VVQSTQPPLVTSTVQTGANDRNDSYQKHAAGVRALAGAFSNLWENAMSNLSRRSLVTTAAALPVLAVPCAALFDHFAKSLTGGD
jgi:hypothetical protein